MAKTNGIVKIEGTIEDLTFYKKNGKNYVRRKGGVSKERIETDPNFVRTRENNTEFAQSAGSGKVLRLALGSLVFRAKDSNLSSRLMQVMSRIKNFDTTSSRGQRNVNTGIATVDGKLQLKGFNFNRNAPLQNVLFAPYDLDIATGKMSFTNLIPAEQLQFPQGATHFSLQSAVLKIDFDSTLSDINFSNIENLPINLTPSSPILTPGGIPAGIGVALFLLTISFYQEVNGVQYSLRNEEYNVLTVLEVT